MASSIDSIVIKGAVSSRDLASQILSVAEPILSQVNGILSLVLYAMQIIETAVGTSGADKKAWVLAVITEAITQSPSLSAEEKARLMDFTTGQLPVLIDIFIGASQGLYALGTQIKQSGLCACLPCCQPTKNSAQEQDRRIKQIKLVKH